jgi:hypothetical protein
MSRYESKRGRQRSFGTEGGRFRIRIRIRVKSVANACGWRGINKLPT